MENVSTDTKLGVYFHNQRVERGITLNEALPGMASALSRFERGQSKLANQSMFTLMANIGIRFEDLYNEIPALSSKTTMLIDRIWRARYSSSSTLNELAGQLNNITVLSEFKGEALQRFSSYIISGIIEALSVKCERSILHQITKSSSWTIDDYQLVMISALFMNSTSLDTVVECCGSVSAEEFSGYRVYYQKCMTEVLIAMLVNGNTNEMKVAVAKRLKTNSITANGDEDVLLVNTLVALANLDSEQIKDKKILQDTVEPFINAASTIGMQGYVAFIQRLCLRLSNQEMAVAF